MLASVNWRWNENSSLKPENQWFLLQRHYDHDSVYDSVHVCKLLAQIERNLGIPWELWRFSTETLREPSLPVGRWFLADHLCPPLEARTGATYHMTSWFFCWDFLFNTHIYIHIRMFLHITIIIYPLVNVYITMENHHAINGKIHYFDWAIFNSKLVSLPGRVYH
jgi:hypothetical protein